MRKGLALPVEYLVILIIAVVVLLAVVVWYLYFFPHCPDPQYVVNQACRGWSSIKCEGSLSDYIVPIAYLPDTRCVDGIINGTSDGKVTMEEACTYAGLSETACRRRCCGG
ncbi:MAG: hypothetical protein NZ942_02855 [Candidatus Aenigmarchaeota archaeon]|nr:hypothetical protein [Candidatus Aenigmarchaeota archaeon]